MLKAIKKRRSIRKYLPKEVEEEKLNEILKAAIFSPSGKNRRPWEFVVVKDEKIKEKLAESGPWASFINNAPVVIVIVGDEEKSWLWIEDCSLAAGHIYLEATNQGLGTCWTHIRGGKTIQGKDPEKFVRKLLKIPNGKRVLCLMPLGYPAEKKEEHKEAEFEKEKIHYEGW